MPDPLVDPEDPVPDPLADPEDPLPAPPVPLAVPAASVPVWLVPEPGVALGDGLGAGGAAAEVVGSDGAGPPAPLAAPPAVAEGVVSPVRAAVVGPCVVGSLPPPGGLADPRELEAPPEPGAPPSPDQGRLFVLVTAPPVEAEPLRVPTPARPAVGAGVDALPAGDGELVPGDAAARPAPA